MLSPRNRNKKRRLQELAQEIPSSDGIGSDLDEALQACHSLRMALAEARERSRVSGEKYAERLRLLQEERDLLSDLGLTENLYREHEDDGDPEVAGQ